MNIYKFNRQEILSKNDIREIMDIINIIESHENDFGSKYADYDSELVNQLFGLFDGYLYDNIIHNANMAMLSLDLVKRIESIVDKVTQYILVKLNNEVGHLEGQVR